MLAQEAYTSLALGVLLLVLERLAARRAAAAGQGSQFSAGMVLALGALFCTVAGYFALQPMMAAARAGQGRAELRPAARRQRGLLRASSWLLVLALAWRAAGARRSVAGLLLDAGQPPLGALDLPPAVTRSLPKTLTFFTVARWLPLLEKRHQLDDARPGHGGRRARPFPWAGSAATAPAACRCAGRARRSSWSASVGEHRLARGAVVGEHAHLDQAVRLRARRRPPSRRPASGRRRRS